MLLSILLVSKTLAQSQLEYYTLFWPLQLSRVVVRQEVLRMVAKGIKDRKQLPHPPKDQEDMIMIYKIIKAADKVNAELLPNRTNSN